MAILAKIEILSLFLSVLFSVFSEGTKLSIAFLLKPQLTTVSFFSDVNFVSFGIFLITKRDIEGLYLGNTCNY